MTEPRAETQQQTAHEKENGKKSVYLQVLLLLFFLSAGHLFCQVPSLEAAREKFDAQEYVAAEEELKAILAADEENIEARKLLNQISQIRKKLEASRLTEIALLEIDGLNFEKALELLKEAVALDPSNKQARELYISLVEVSAIERESAEEGTRIDKQEEEQREREQIVTAAPEQAPAAEPVEGIQEDVGKGGVAIEQPPPSQTALQISRKELSVRMSTALTFTGSNALDYIDSNLVLLGLVIDSRYYLPFFQRRIGLSLDYSGNLLKAGGDDNINFLVHRLNASVRFRHYLFEVPGYREAQLIVGARVSYHLFYLQNLLEQGAYNFKVLYGPSFGFFVSDPLLYRFIRNDLLRDFGFEGQADFLFLPAQEGSSGIFAFEFFAGSYYRLNKLSIGLGYRQYSIFQRPIKEHYRNVELGVEYRL